MHNYPNKSTIKILSKFLNKFFKYKPKAVFHLLNIILVLFINYLSKEDQLIVEIKRFSQDLHILQALHYIFEQLSFVQH